MKINMMNILKESGRGMLRLNKIDTDICVYLLLRKSKGCFDSRHEFNGTVGEG